MSTKETPSLWEERNGDDEKKGRFYEQARQLNLALHNADNLGMLHDTGNGQRSMGLQTRTVADDDQQVTILSEACIRPADKDIATYVAIGMQRQSTDSVDKTYFVITENGVAVYMDGMIDVPDGDPMVDILSTSMQISTDTLESRIAFKESELTRQEALNKRAHEQRIRAKQQHRQQVIRNLTKAVLVTTGAAGVIGGGMLLLKV